MTADELLVTAMSLNSTQDDTTYASADLTQTTLATASQSTNRNIIDVDLDRNIVDVDHADDFRQTKISSFYNKSSSQQRTEVASSSSSSSQSDSSYNFVNPNSKTSLDPFHGLTADQVEKLSQFQDITGTDVDTAKHLLEVLTSFND